MDDKMRGYIEKLNEWLAVEGLEPGLKDELETILHRYQVGPNEANSLAISDRFYKDLEFGTGGIRAVVGAGANRMNLYTIRKISQGFAREVLKTAKVRGINSPSMVISYDNRRGSDAFAFEAACVFLANGFKVYMFEQLTPTPVLSFAVRRLACTAGVMVTASHNPKEYNGYKVYNSYGCQYLPEEADEVVATINSLDIWKDTKTIAGEFTGDLQEKISSLLDSDYDFHLVPTEIHSDYIAEVLSTRMQKGALAEVGVVYTPLHGTGKVFVEEVLTKAGIGSLEIVSEQAYPDSEFTNAPEPNPEKRVALDLGLRQARELNAIGKTIDALLATDPDADRLGMAVLHEGDYQILSGNEVGILIFDYLVCERAKAGLMPSKPLLVTTIVSSPMVLAIAKAHGVAVKKVLTGFKFIGEQMDILADADEIARYVFGYEESCGYLTGTYARDKDSINACLIVSEMIGVYKRQGKTLLDRLAVLNEQYGYFIDDTQELVRPGEKGMYEIATMMENLGSEETKQALLGELNSMSDYKQGKRWEFLGENTSETDIQGIRHSDVLEFDFLDGTRVLARPSGTEPKLKIYYTGVGEAETEAKNKVAQLKEKIERQLKS